MIKVDDVTHWLMPAPASNCICLIPPDYVTPWNRMLTSQSACLIGAQLQMSNSASSTDPRNNDALIVPNLFRRKR